MLFLQIKLGIVKFLSNEIFSNDDILIHLIVAAADTRFSVANLADMELKKVVGYVVCTTKSARSKIKKTFKVYRLEFTYYSNATLFDVSGNTDSER